MPLNITATIFEKTLVRIKIFKAEAIEEQMQQELVSEEIEVTFEDKKGLPVYIIKGKFHAALPFNPSCSQ